MSISGRFRELWQKVRFAGGWQVRMLLLTAVLLGGFLSFYQLRASADNAEDPFKIHIYVSSDRCYGCTIPNKPKGDYDGEINKYDGQSETARTGYSDDLKDLKFPTHVKITRSPSKNKKDNDAVEIYNNGEVTSEDCGVGASWFYDSKANSCHYWTITVPKEDKTYYYFIEFTGNHEGEYFVGDSTDGKCVKVKSNNNEGYIYKGVSLIKSDYPKFKYQDQYEKKLNATGYVSGSSDKNNFCCYDTGTKAPCVVGLATEGGKLCMNVRFQGYSETDYNTLPKPARIDDKYFSERSKAKNTRSGNADYFMVPVEEGPNYTMTFLVDNDGKWGNYYYIDRGESLSEPAKSIFWNDYLNGVNQEGGFFKFPESTNTIKYKKCKKENTDSTHYEVVYSSDQFPNITIESTMNAITFDQNSVSGDKLSDTEGGAIEDFTISPTYDSFYSINGTKLTFKPTSNLKGPVIKIKNVNYSTFTTTFECQDGTVPENSISVTNTYGDYNGNDVTVVKDSKGLEEFKHEWRFDQVHADPTKISGITKPVAYVDMAGAPTSLPADWIDTHKVVDITPVLDDKTFYYTVTPNTGYVFSDDFKLTNSSGESLAHQDGSSNTYRIVPTRFDDSTFTVSNVRRQITPTFTSTDFGVQNSVEVEIKNGNKTITEGVGTTFTQQILGVGETTLDVTLKIKDGDWRRFKTDPNDCVACEDYDISGIAGSSDGKTVTFTLNHDAVDSGTITITSDIFQNTVFVDSKDTTTFPNSVFSKNYTLTATKPAGANATSCTVEKVSQSTGFDHGWVVYLDSDTSANITITGDNDLHYGFASFSGVTYTNGTNTDGTNITRSLGQDYGLSGDDRYNKMDFQLTNLSNSPDENTVKISGLAYLEYTNTFNYCAGTADISTYLTVSTELTNETTWGAAANVKNYVQTWSYASPTGFNNYKVTTKDGYAIGSTFEIKDDSTTITATNKGDKNCEFTLDCKKDNTQLKDHTVTLGPVMSRYGLKFQPTGNDKSSIQDYVSISYNDSTSIGWNATNYAIIDTTLGDQITVKLTLNDKRREFISDPAAEIKISDSTKYTLATNRTSDNEITITLSHAATDGCTIEVGDIIAWKNTTVKINVDVSNIGSEHMNGLTLKVNNETENFSKDTSKNNVYSKTLENKALNKLDFTVTCSNPTGIVFNDDATVKARWGGTVIDEISVTTKPSGTAPWNDAITFTLDISKLPNLSAETLEFDIEGLESVYRDVEFNLCQNTVLYNSSGDQLYKGGEFASSLYTDKIIYGQTGTKYTIVYSDYSKIFDLSKVTVEDEEGTLFNGEMNGKDQNNYNTDNGLELTLPSFNKVEITLPTMEDKIIISCKDPGETSPMASFSSVEGIQYGIVGSDSSIEWFGSKRKSVDYNAENFQFYVKALDGYDIDSLKISSNGKELEGAAAENYPNAKLFTVPGPVTSSMSITGSISAKQCTVAFNTKVNLKTKGAGETPIVKYYYNGLELTPDAGKCTITALYGNMISFGVELPEGYTQSPDMIVYCTGKSSETLKKIDGQYLISNITEDKEVTIENLSLNDYPITFTSSDKVVFHGCESNKPTSGSPKTTIEHGGDYQFSIKNKEGYNLDDMVVVAKYSNGEMLDVVELSGGEHCYQISNVTQSFTISAENVSNMEYTVTLEPVDGIIYQNDVGNVITDKVVVKHGNNFEFYVVLADAYDDSKDNIYVQVTNGGSYIDPPRKLAIGRYIVQNITHDVSLKIGNVAKNNYVVSLMDEEGIDYYDSNGKVITGENDVEHNADLKFKVNLYPAYAGSDITVMLGDTPMKADSSGFYTISNVTESKTVTVTGIEESAASELVNSINSLPDSIRNLGDVDDVIELTKIYESLSDEEKAMITNIDKLTKLQEESKQYNHVSNGVTVEGVDWYVKLYANPITDDTDACGRIYKNLTSEYILSLYDVYLWNTLTDTRYTLPEGQSAVIHLPTPDMQYFDNPTAVHEKSSSKLEFLILSVNGDTSSFTTSSFSAMGIVANRNSTPGRSSLLDAADANLDAISNFAAAAFGNSSTTVTNTNFSDLDSSSGSNSNSDVLGSVTDGDTASDNISGNIDEKFRGRQNKVTPAGSALRLILVLMILILLSVILYLYFKRKKNKEKSSNG